MIDSPDFKQDIKITRRVFDRQTSDRESVDFLTSAGGDVVTVSDRENLAQAILNRLLTRKGELAKLGHPDYGSRLHLLIGELNNSRMQGFAALYIRECLAQEPRVQEIKRLTFVPPGQGGDRSLMEATITVVPVGQSQDLTLTLSFNLRG